jgi:hypothetical protein
MKRAWISIYAREGRVDVEERDEWSGERTKVARRRRKQGEAKSEVGHAVGAVKEIRFPPEIGCLRKFTGTCIAQAL